jgi:hypothetical protein
MICILVAMRNMLVLHHVGQVDVAGYAMPYVKIAWMEIYKHA